MNAQPTVSEALRRFLPAFLETAPPLSRSQWRAIWAINRCRTPSLGGRAFECQQCGRVHFAYHSCNHKACPQCGRQATAEWIERELKKLVDAPYFLVTFTLPSELRPCFFGPAAKEAYDLFFNAVSGALKEKLAEDKGFKAHVSGFTAVLHTWNQRLEFHPHIHCLVPGAGLDEEGKPVRVSNPDFLVYLPHLQAAFRQHMRQQLDQHRWQVNPEVWTKDWGVHIQPAGSGAPALKYLGNYVARTAITDSRIVGIDEQSVTFRWKDRSNGNRTQLMTLPGVEFVARYLRHVLPEKLRSLRYYGFCHPAAKARRLRIKFNTGIEIDLGAERSSQTQPEQTPPCPNCGGPTRYLYSLRAPYKKKRGPPIHHLPIPQPSEPIAA